MSAMPSSRFCSISHMPQQKKKQQNENQELIVVRQMDDWIADFPKTINAIAQ